MTRRRGERRAGVAHHRSRYGGNTPSETLVAGLSDGGVALTATTHRIDPESVDLAIAAFRAPNWADDVLTALHTLATHVTPTRFAMIQYGSGRRCFWYRDPCLARCGRHDCRRAARRRLTPAVKGVRTMRTTERDSRRRVMLDAVAAGDTNGVSAWDTIAHLGRITPDLLGSARERLMTEIKLDGLVCAVRTGNPVRYILADTGRRTLDDGHPAGV